jgi:uncharacterized protein YecT (DUF1311 family)
MHVSSILQLIRRFAIRLIAAHSKGDTMKHALLTLTVLFFLPVIAARADDAAPEIDCANASATVELNFCAEKELDTADVALNAVYKKVLAFIAKSGTEKPYDAKSWEDALRESQRAWVAFRDADCKGLIPMSWTGGTGATGAVLGCMSEKTKARTEELESLYKLEK